MKKRKIAILLSVLMLCTNISYVGIDGSAEEPKNVVEESELQITEIESGATVQNQKTGRYGAARTTENKSLYDGTCGKNATWHFDAATGTLTISGKGAVRREEAWYSFAGKVKKIVVKNGITSLEKWSFYHYYPNLVRVEFPASVKKISDWTFSECTSLSEVILPEGLTEIGAEAFSECQSLRAINIPKNVMRIGDSAFRNCVSLEKVQLPKNLKEIGLYYVFKGCKRLKSISIPGSLNEISMGTFEGCTSLKSVSIESGVQTIGMYAFDNCISLKNIVIPASASLVAEQAFTGCSRLENVTFLGKGTRITESTFENTPKFIISGYSGSTAQRYAKAHGKTFRNLEKHTHRWEAAGVKTEPTCTRAGVNYMKCSVCDQQKEVTVNALGHKYANGKCVRCRAWQKISLRTCTVSISSSAYIYRGSEIRPTVTVKNGSKVLKKGTDYTVTYRSNKEIGKAYVIIQGKERYSGSRTLTFKIQPKGTSFVQAKSSASGRMQLSWKKVTDVSGYQIRLRTGGTSEIRTRVGDTKLSTVLTGLKKGTTYRTSIRTYQMVDGQRYYSWWSKEEAVPVKK